MFPKANGSRRLPSRDPEKFPDRLERFHMDGLGAPASPDVEPAQCIPVEVEGPANGPGRGKALPGDDPPPLREREGVGEPEPEPVAAVVENETATPEVLSGSIPGGEEGASENPLRYPHADDGEAERWSSGEFQPCRAPPLMTASSPRSQEASGSEAVPVRGRRSKSRSRKNPPIREIARRPAPRNRASDRRRVPGHPQTDA